MQTCSTWASDEASNFDSESIFLRTCGRLSAILLGAALFLVFPGHAQPGLSPVQASDLLNISEIREVRLSPSGRTVAYTVREADTTTRPAAASDHTRLYAVPASGREPPRLLTRSDQNVSDPSWHPDGNQIAFVRPVNGTPQVFVISLSGGEPYQLTEAPHGATDPQWSPSGDRLLFASSLPERSVRRQVGRPPPSERPARSPRDILRGAPPDTLLVLRHAQTLDPVDTLALDGQRGPHRLPDDTARTLRIPARPSVPEQRTDFPADSLRRLQPDSVRALFQKLGVRPDTTTVAPTPDTAATTDGDLLQIRRWIDQRSNEDAQVFSRLSLRDNGQQAPAPFYRHYFYVDVPDNITSGTPSRPEPTPVTRGYRSFDGGDWLPSGTQIVMSAPPNSATHPDRVQKRNLYVLDLDTGRMQRLLSIEGFAVTAPRTTSDGTTLAFQAEPLSSQSYSQTELGLFELDGRSAPKFITNEFDRDVVSHRWSPDGWYLYVTAPSRSGRPLYRFAPFAQDDTTDARGRTSLQDAYSTSRDTFALDSSMVTTAVHDRMTGTDRVVQDVDVTDSNAIYAALSPERPSELYANTISFTNEQSLSSHNEWLDNRRLSRSSRISAWSQGLRVYGRVTPPLGDTSAQSPLVVIPRGGPPGLSASDPVTDWMDRQYLAGRGYGVLEVWPRGSAGFGSSFRRKNFQNWGPAPANDVLALVDTIASRSWVDSTRQLLVGRSYGGFLTTWLTAHTDRFQAAVAQSGVYDLTSFFGEGAAWRLIPEQFGGYPWETTAPATTPADRPTSVFSAGFLPPSDTTTSPHRALRRNSPITAAHRIETPLLLMHGEHDHQTGPAQAEMLYRRLKILERPVEYVRYPKIGHDFSDAEPDQRIDRLLRVYEFLARYAAPSVPSARPPSSP